MTDKHQNDLLSVHKERYFQYQQMKHLNNKMSDISDQIQNLVKVITDAKRELQKLTLMEEDVFDSKRYVNHKQVNRATKNRRVDSLFRDFSNEFIQGKKFLEHMWLFVILLVFQNI